MTNQQVFQAFADGRAASGNSVHVEIHGTVALLYSYSTPIAWRDPGGVARFDAHSYSATTSKQRTQALREFPTSLAFKVSHADFLLGLKLVAPLASRGRASAKQSKYVQR